MQHISWLDTLVFFSYNLLLWAAFLYLISGRPKPPRP